MVNSSQRSQEPLEWQTRSANKDDLTWHLFLLARCLSPNFSSNAVSSLRECLSAEILNWEQILAFANGHFVTGSLYWSLKEKDLLSSLPDEVQAFLTLIYSENERRNLEIRKQTLEVVSGLASDGIRPILLKGAVVLFENPINSIGRRMMGDIDILIPADSLQSVEDCMARNGYRAVIIESMWHKHDQVFVHDERSVAIDIHRSIGPQNLLLPVGEALPCAVRIGDPDCGITALSSTHRILHNIFHSEIQDRNHTFGRLSISSLNDHAALVSNDSDIDWNMIAGAMRRYGSYEILTSFVYASHQLLLLPMPPRLEPTRRARRHFRRCLGLLRQRRKTRFLRFADRFSAPLKKTAIGFAYSCEESRYLRVYFRVVHLATFVRKNRLAALRKMAHRFSFFRASGG